MNKECEFQFDKDCIAELCCYDGSCDCKNSKGIPNYQDPALAHRLKMEKDERDKNKTVNHRPKKELPEEGE